MGRKEKVCSEHDHYPKEHESRGLRSSKLTRLLDPVYQLWACQTAVAKTEMAGKLLSDKITYKDVTWNRRTKIHSSRSVAKMIKKYKTAPEGNGPRRGQKPQKLEQNVKSHLVDKHTNQTK